MAVSSNFWPGRSVFVTGHTGFKGGWLSTWLLAMGARVTGYALPPETVPSYFALCDLSHRMRSHIADINDGSNLRRAIQETAPEIVFHLAAQPLVRRSYREPAATFATNVMGTINLLEAVRVAPSVRAVVVVTSDKCYENQAWPWAYRETDPLGGHDPYSTSKACAELAVTAWRRSFFETQADAANIATVRAGNVIGGGDWSEDRLVPDAVRAFSRGEALKVRNPAAVRPWQHVMEPLAGYLMLAEKLCREGLPWTGAWNFGPGDDAAVTTSVLATELARQWGGGFWEASTQSGQVHEAHYLRLDSGRARQSLQWRPRLGLPEAVALTVEWYQEAMNGGAVDMYALSCAQIEHYRRLGDLAVNP
jgi:CDP-glucose 4,6-dehydratase